MKKDIIKKIIGESNILRIKKLIYFRYKNKFNTYKNKKKIIYMLIPSHGNMGDQAIALATLKYFKDNFSEYEIIEIYREDTYKYANAIKKVINKNDIIALHGGGNMGNLYPVEERERRAIIKMFPNNKIISMTQTISFTNDIYGKKEFLKTKNIYSSHKDLTLIAREKISYEIMKNNLLNNNIILNPDIVFYLSDMYEFEKEKRNRIMTCLRSDKESLLGNSKIEFINKLSNKYGNVFTYDTVIDKVITKDIREKELKRMFDEFLKSKVVITDRLHGMIFCVITKTPCIVTKSLDHKVIGTYEWVKDLNYIKLVDNLNFDEINSLIDELLDLNTINKIDFNNIYFEKLSNKLNEIIK